jgi:hypothetical protein
VSAAQSSTPERASSDESHPLRDHVFQEDSVVVPSKRRAIAHNPQKDEVETHGQNDPEQWNEFKAALFFDHVVVEGMGRRRVHSEINIETYELWRGCMKTNKKKRKLQTSKVYGVKAAQRCAAVHKLKIYFDSM